MRYWYGAICIAGLGFGLLGERRPFGQSILAHPFIVYAFVAAAGLLVIRVVRQQPVPELIPERALGLGCAAASPSFSPGTSLPRTWSAVDQAFTTVQRARPRLTPSQG